MTLTQKIALFPLYRWLDQRDIWRFWFAMAMALVFPLSAMLSTSTMMVGICVVAYVILTRWAWITKRLR